MNTDELKPATFVFLLRLINTSLSKMLYVSAHLNAWKACLAILKSLTLEDPLLHQHACDER